MNEKNEKQTSELSMEELDNVAGGGTNQPYAPTVAGPVPAPPAAQVTVTKSLSNIKNN